MALHIADTNVYLMATRNDEYRSRFEAFVWARGPLRVSSVVAAEILIGVADSRRHTAVLRSLEAGTDIVAPTPKDWFVAGAALARLGGGAVTKGRSFWNDALLAAQCARLGAVLITENVRDFKRLGVHIPVRSVKPFPAS